MTRIEEIYEWLLPRMKAHGLDQENDTHRLGCLIALRDVYLKIGHRAEDILDLVAITQEINRLDEKIEREQNSG